MAGRGQDVVCPLSTPPSPIPKKPELLKYNYLYKLIIIGDPSVGKTNLTMKFCQDQFNPNYLSTIGIDFKVKTVEIEGRRVKLQVWDTAGQERFQSICNTYYRGVHGVVFVYDVTHRPSFTNIKKWVSSYENATGDVTTSSEIPKVLLANKCDHDEKLREVSQEEGKATAKCLGLTFYETSAKTGYNVEEAFTHVAKQILLRTEDKPGSETKMGSRGNKKRGRNERIGFWSSVCSLL